MPTYRKTQKNEWVAYGNPAEIHAGSTVLVTRRDGTTETRWVERVGKPFTTNDGQRVYGYLRPLTNTQPARTTKPTIRVYSDANPHGNPAGMCDECGTRRATTTARDSSGIVGAVCTRCAREGDLSFA